MTGSTELPSERPPGDVPVLHEFKNHLSVIIGYCDVLLRELPDDDPKRPDIVAIREAGNAAMRLLPELSERMR